MFDLAQYAFQFENSAEYHKRFHYLAKHSINYGSFEGDDLASQVMLTPFDVNFFQKTHKMGGVGFVSSDPSFRGGCRIDAIMKELLKDCYEQGILFSYLAPFSYPFYRRYGYELLFERSSYRISHQDWPRVASPKGKVLRKDWQEAKASIAKIYAATMAQEEGCLLRETWWYEYKYQMKPGNYFALYYDEEAQVQGYLVYQMKAGVFTIVEWVYLTEAAYRGLHKYIASHADSVQEFFYERSANGQTPFFLNERPISQLSSRPDMMVKIVDIEAFLKVYPFESLQNSFAIEIEEDSYSPWNTGIFEIHVQSNREVVIQKVVETNLPLMKTSIQRFTQLFLGYKSLEELVFYRFLVLEPELENAISAIFPKKRPILEDYF